MQYDVRSMAACIMALHDEQSHAVGPTGVDLARIEILLHT